MTDWRLTNQESYLSGATLIWGPYRPLAGNDHDHCEFCGGKFLRVASLPNFQEGYHTPDRYRWICRACHSDFAAQFGWKTTVDPLATVELPPATVQPIPRTLELPVGPDTVVRVVIAPGVLEWYASANSRSTDEELWADWADYQGYAQARDDDPLLLTAEMARHIQLFLDMAATSSAFRVSPVRLLGILPSRRPEWLLPSGWAPVSLVPPPGA